MPTPVIIVTGVSRAFASLALPDSDYITGQFLAVDGATWRRGCRVDTATTARRPTNV